MQNSLHEFLLQQPVLVFFLVLGLGYMIGNIRFFAISLGSVGGVLIAGLVFGHFGYTMYPGMQSMGFALFIFCVGYQAGPQFFDVLLTSGLKYLSLALVVAVTGFGLAVGLASALGFAPGMAAGLMGGALTTTPTLAAAQDAVRSGLVTAPEGFTNEEVLTNIGAGYALTYLFGLIGLILVIRLLPRILGIDLPAEAAKLRGGRDPEAGPDLSRITRRTYRVTNVEDIDKTILELERESPGEIIFAGLRRDGEEVTIDNETRLAVGDEVLVIGQIDRLLTRAHLRAQEISDAAGLSVPMTTFKVVVSNPSVIGRPLQDVEISERLNVLPLAVYRQRTELPLSLEMELHRGDVITFYGPEFAIDSLVRHVGHVERAVDDTDLFTFALGIAAGIGLGTLSINIGAVSIGLGMAGGLLITGLVIGFLRSIWPIFGRVPSAARWVLMELGLLLFMAGVGLNAGGGIVEIIQNSGLKLLGAGVVVTLVPTLIGYFFSRKILQLNPAEALGGVTGSMTSGAALSVVCDAAKSNVPALGYTGAYAFANVILTLAGTFIMLL
jgi:putative transport protein